MFYKYDGEANFSQTIASGHGGDIQIMVTKSYVLEDCNTPNKLLTIKEVAAILKISVPTLRRMMQRNEIDSVKINGSRRFEESEIERYIKSKKRD